MNEAFKEHFGYRPMTVDETEYMLLKSPWYGEQTAWIAIQNNLPLGYIVAGTDKELNREKNAKHGWINDIAVLKPFRRQKIGTRLLQTAMQHLRNIGMQDALLYVDDQNVTGAKKLYEAIGFKLFHTYVAYELQLI
jgi:ribosomal protein S18 acetylase RimI-like enzyme